MFQSLLRLGHESASNRSGRVPRISKSPGSPRAFWVLGAPKVTTSRRVSAAHLTGSGLLVPTDVVGTTEILRAFKQKGESNVPIDHS